MTEVLFYHLTESTLEDALPGLLERSVERGWRAIVQTGTEDRRDALDGHLWTYRDDSFLAHATDREPHPAEQPILLTTGEGNPNGSKIRFLVDGASPPALADYCVSAGAAAPTWCWLREQVVLGFLYDVYGIAALAATALALAWRRGASAWLAAALGAFAVGLYCYQAGAFALLTGCLLLLRSRPAAARDEYRGGDEPMQAQP